MPSKSHRVAARQTQLAQRRKRSSRGPMGIPVGTEYTQAATTEKSPGVRAQAPQSKASTLPEQYTRVRREVLRILIITSALFALLIILSFILK